MKRMIETDLGLWRRTMYSNEIDPSMEGKEVIVMGWVSSVRDHGNLIFVMLNDKEGEMQITAKAGVTQDEIRENLVAITRHEFGHAIGLGHSTLYGDLMYPDINIKSAFISECNVKALIALYDGKGLSQVVCEK